MIDQTKMDADIARERQAFDEFWIRKLMALHGMPYKEAANEFAAWGTASKLLPLPASPDRSAVEGGRGGDQRT